MRRSGQIWVDVVTDALTPPVISQTNTEMRSTGIFMQNVGKYTRSAVYSCVYAALYIQTQLSSFWVCTSSNYQGLITEFNELTVQFASCVSLLVHSRASS